MRRPSFGYRPNREEQRRRQLTAKLKADPEITATVGSISTARALAAWMALIFAEHSERLEAILPPPMTAMWRIEYYQRPLGYPVMIAESHEWPGLAVIATAKR